MLKKPIYISTKFLDCEIESVSYKIYYQVNSYGEHFKGISKVKIEEATIYINWTGIYQFLKYYFDKNEIFYPAKPEEWDANLGKDEFFFFSQLYKEKFNVKFGKIEFPNITYTYDNLIYVSPDLIPDSELDLEPNLKKIVNNLEKPLAKEIIKYSCPQLKINSYPVKRIYWLLEEIVNKIIKKVIEKIEINILYREIFEYHYFGREIKDFYQYNINLRRTSIGNLLKKYAEYNKTIIKAITMIETELNNFIKSENFVKIIEEHLKEKTTLEKFLKELKKDFSFWNKFYYEFCEKYLRNSENIVKAFPILKYCNEYYVKCFIIPKIHNKAFEMVKNRLSIFAL